MNKKILFFTLLAFAIMPILTSATTLASMAESAMHAIVMAAGFVVVIIWVITGILFLMAMGDPSKLNAAKIGLISAVIGTVLVIIAQYATDFVGGIFGI